jgi:hypothetical protein
MRNLVFIGLLSLSTQVLSETFLTVHQNLSTSRISQFLLVDTVSQEGRVLELDASTGSVIWSWKVPREIQSRTKLCNGAVAQPFNEESVEVLLPHYGIVRVQRDGSSELIVNDSEISHAFSRIGDDSVAYARGFVDKNEHSFVIHSTTSKNETRSWTPQIYFTNKADWAIETNLCEGRHKENYMSEKQSDWAHANDIKHLPNGNLLVSMRNLSLFAEVTSAFKVEKVYQGITGSHQPTPIDRGFIASDRSCGSEALILVSDSGKKTRLFDGEFMTVRGIEPLGDNHFLITSATSVLEVSLDGQVHYQATVPGVEPEIEKRVKKNRDLPKVGKCAPKTLYKAWPTRVRN